MIARFFIRTGMPGFSACDLTIRSLGGILYHVRENSQEL